MPSLLEQLAPDSRERVDTLLLGTKWTLPGEHPLAALDGPALDGERLLVLLGPKNAVGSRYFRLFLLDGGGNLGEPALALGLHNNGPVPAYNWVELTRYEPVVAFEGRRLDIRDDGDARLFQLLSSLVPAGGHIMCEYDSPGQKATERVLTLGYPPATSPIGYLMIRAGVRSYRDWYISEGGREGPRKLQGFKPLTEEIAREKTAQLRGQLEALVARPENVAHGGWGRLARENAAKVLKALASDASTK